MDRVRNMPSFEKELLHEVQWRIDEISLLKTIPHLYKFSDIQKKVLQKYSIPSIYSLWEGFVSDSFSLYIRKLNELKLLMNQLSQNIIVHDLDVKYHLSDGRKNFDKKVSLVKNVYNYIKSPINLSSNIPTKSNINFNVINDVLKRFKLQPLPEKPYGKELDKLVLIRNNISHGQVIASIDQGLIDELSINTMNIIYEVFNRIVEGYRNKTYLNDSF